MSCRDAASVQPFVLTLPLSVHLAVVSSNTETWCFSKCLCRNFFFCLFFAVEINQCYLSSKERGGNEGNRRKSNKASTDDGGTEWQVESLCGGQDDSIDTEAAAEATRLFLHTHFDQSESGVAALQHSCYSNMTVFPSGVQNSQTAQLCKLESLLFLFSPGCFLFNLTVINMLLYLWSMRKVVQVTVCSRSAFLTGQLSTHSIIETLMNKKFLG